MKRIFVALLLISFIIGFAGCTTYEDFDKESAIKITDPIIENTMEGINENNYEKYSEYLTDSYKKSFTEKSFLEFTEGFYQNPGKYISKELYEIRPINNGVLIHYKGTFEKKDNVAITVTFEIIDGQYKIKKLRFY
ncbi:MAG: DUF3887 domain-containing protein [Candidatus Methanofastidiosa archaeon]|jgi:hypothetical protein|nr:DUF3887 domain-containing protein [Candidatus Methanofastidiosa archaeon]